MSRTLGGAMVFLSAGLLLAVTAAAPLAASQEGDDKGVTITGGEKKEETAKAKLVKGTILTIKLSGNPTTGFHWLLDKNDKEALPQQGKHKYEAAKEGAVGGGGTFTYVFKAEKVGSTELELVYKRPFEKDKVPARTFKVKVVVEQPPSFAAELARVPLPLPATRNSGEVRYVLIRKSVAAIWPLKQTSTSLPG
jgi:inhibitor of cysteine peptidase